MDPDVQEYLNEIYSELTLIKNGIEEIQKYHGIVPELTADVSNIEESIISYKSFADEKLNLSDRTIKMYAASILKFLYFSQGEINDETVKVYLQSNSSQSWKNQELKALRSYCKKFLSLGVWIDEFEIINIDKVNRKEMPKDLELAEFFHELQGLSTLVFLLLHDTGLRLDEIIQSTLGNFDFETNSIDVSSAHTGESKSSYLSFYQDLTRDLLRVHIKNYRIHELDQKMISISARGVELEFQRVSNEIGVQITPKDLRKIFVTKLSNADIKDRFIDCLQGRIPKNVIAKHYTDYGLENLKTQYDKANLSLPL